MSTGRERLQHIVVLMMENRSFDHMLGYLQAQDPRIDGVDGSESNPDSTGSPAFAEAKARYQAQLQPDPGHHFEDVDRQIFGVPRGTGPAMTGFVRDYFRKRQDVKHSRKIMYCFRPEKVPVITTLARRYAVFNRWFSSVPGPTIPNRAFAHFGTSFGKTSMDLNYLNVKYSTIYERMLSANRSAKIYYFDPASGTLGMAFMLARQPRLFGTFEQFKADCADDRLPDYSFIEPNYKDHSSGAGQLLASDQHPDNNVLAGEEFIASVYSHIASNQTLFEKTLLLITYDEHGGLFDHVPPPACTPDEFQDPATGFAFDRLGVRVPAVAVSPWIPENTVDDRVFEHASIPATVTERFIGPFTDRSPRELAAGTFLDLLTLPEPREDAPGFQLNRGSARVDASAGTVFIEPPPDRVRRDRPLTVLQQEQVREMYLAEMMLPAEQQTGIDVSTVTTERAAAAYTDAVMRRLQAPDGR